MNASQRGFTLVEVLVVLVITALVSTLLFQALAQVYRLQERFGEQLSDSRGGEMRADWYRQVVQGLQTDYVDGSDLFAGNRQRLEGLTALPLSPLGGAPQRVVLEIVPIASGGELRYAAGPQRFPLLRWAGSAPGEFVYLDDAGTGHEVWPPQAGSAWPQLPAAILLRWPGRQGQEAVVAVPTGSREAKQRSMPMLSGAS